ncbi:MAG TPA: FAD:protein FMN transferase [Dermatophilaceae bacterium]|nr:FAD:protein FMN transferase [Dermatophilaceae bacterium]
MTRRAWVEHHMGMPMSIHLRGDDLARPEVEKAVATAYALLARMDEIFSTWSPDSQVSRLRRGELALSDCDPLVHQAARIGGQAEELTSGAFTTLLPDADGMPRFDPAGLVKGWAVDLAGDELRGLPGVSWCINAGGDVRAGRHQHVPPTGEDAMAWRIGIENPYDRSQIARVVPLTDGAVATSGTAARGAHLYDPHTRQAVGRPGSTSVVGPDLLWSDIWATALFVGGATTRAAFAEHPAYEVVDL